MASSILARLAVLISGDASGLNKNLSGATKNLNSFSQSAKNVGRDIAGFLGVASFGLLAKQVLDVTSNFQRFEAVLTNTLGSNSEAQRALDLIKDFAAKTPFSVQELTGSFVKLANQGFKPTADEMRRLGDLASSTGKGFDQLTEAIIDAQVGEFERLKEFGIRASKSGDQVKFTFKGVETQTKFTADTIRDYILSLGELEGVSGSMAAISETLGGKISNLGDSFDNLLLSIGNATSGPAAAFIDFLNSALAGATDALTDDKVFTRLDTVKDLYVDTATTVEEVTANLEKLNRVSEVEKKNYEEATAALGDYKTQTSLSAEEFFKLGVQQRDAKEFVNAYAVAIELLTKKLEELNVKTQTQALSLIPALNAEIKHFEELKNQAFDIDSIGRYNEKLKELKTELELINLAGSESGFLRNLNATQEAGGVPSIQDFSQIAPVANPFDTTFSAEHAATIFQPYIDGILKLDEAGELFNQNQATRDANDIARKEAAQARLQEQINTAQEYGSAIGDAFGQAATGQITFVQALKKATADIAKTLLARAMAGIIASAATAGGPPPVAIALAAAGVAAIGALFSKFVGIGGGGGGGGSIGTRATDNVSRLTRSQLPEDRIESNVRFEIEGTKLIGVTNNTNNKKQRTG